jgi:RNA polymerase sigma-70 factor, ECF subfamily
MAQVSTAEELLARVAGRDASALGELYDAFAPNLLGLILRILGNRSKAEEVLDEVFLRLWDEASVWVHEGSSAAARLVVLARNAAVERLRAERASPVPVHAQADDCLKISSAWLPLPQEVAAVDERRELLKKIINQLPEGQRRALDLAVFDGYTELELAGKLGEPLGRTKTELRAAMRFLRHRLRAVLGLWPTSI